MNRKEYWDLLSESANGGENTLQRFRIIHIRRPVQSENPVGAARGPILTYAKPVEDRRLAQVSFDEGPRRANEPLKQFAPKAQSHPTRT